MLTCYIFLHCWYTLFQSCVEATRAVFTYKGTLYSYIRSSPVHAVGGDSGPSSTNLQNLTSVVSDVEYLRNHTIVLMRRLTAHDAEPEINETWNQIQDGWLRYFSLAHAVHHVTDNIVQYYHPYVQNCTSELS